MISRRPRAGLAGRLSQLTSLREGQGVSRTKTVGVVRDGSIVALKKGVEPLITVLDKARTEGRPPRSTEYMHVSDLIGKCTRKLALVERVGMQAQSQSLNYFDALTFAQGDAIHDVIRNRASLAAPDQVWGNWQCRCGTKTTRQPCLRSEVDQSLCTACKTPMDRYKEIWTL